MPYKLKDIVSRLVPHKNQYLDVQNMVIQNEREVEIYCYGEIMDGFWFEDPVHPYPGFVTQESLKAALDAANGKPVTLRIHSPGGSLMTAGTIRALLMDYKGGVTCRIDGFCASAATLIATAGKRTLIQDTGFFMIHEPMMVTYGDIKDHKEAITILKELGSTIVQAYQNKTKLSEEELAKMMSDETWMSAKTALGYGFVDEIVTEPVPAGVSNRMSQAANIVATAMRGFENLPPTIKQFTEMNVTEEPGSSDQAAVSEAEAELAKEIHAKAVQALREKIQVQREGERYDISL